MSVTVLVRGRQAGLLFVGLARAVPWPPVLAAAGLSVVAVVPAWAGLAAPAAAVWGLRIAALLLGAGASFAMVDAMAPATVSATPRWLRQWLRFAVVAVPSAVVWAGLCVVTVSIAPGGLPVADLVGEALGCSLCGLAGAAVAARVGHSPTVALAGPAAQGAAVAVTLLLTGGNSPWLLPGEPRWPDVHVGWWVVVAVLVSVLLAANRDVWPLVRGRFTRPGDDDRPAARCAVGARRRGGGR